MGESAVNFAQDLDAVVLLVVNAQQVNAVLFGDNGLAKQLKAGTAVMVSSLFSAQDAKLISQKLTDLGLLMLDAPVSGGAAKAARRNDRWRPVKQTFDKLQPVLNAVAGKVYNIMKKLG